MTIAVGENCSRFFISKLLGHSIPYPGHIAAPIITLSPTIFQLQIHLKQDIFDNLTSEEDSIDSALYKPMKYSVTVRLSLTERITNTTCSILARSVA